MKFLPNKKLNNNKKKITGGVIIALLLIMAFFKENVGHVVSTPIMAASSYLLSSNEDVGNWFKRNAAYLEQKKSLEEENGRLKATLTELESRSLLCRSLEQENNQLREAASHVTNKNKKFITAAIVKRPPAIPYDTLILDAGSESGITTGMTVTIYGEALLGQIVEVFPGVSKVKLISFPANETSVILGNQNISASAVGRGGENLEIDLPKDIQTNIGDLITTPGLDGLVVGSVDKIETNDSSPFQKIIFRLPINIQQLGLVMIEK